MNATEVDVRFAAFVRDGDPADLAVVFDALAPDLLLLAAHVSWSGTDAEDLVQATFVTAIERRDDYDTSRPVRPWLVGILVNHARNSNRKVRRELVGEQGVQGVSADASRDDAAGPADAAVTQEVLACVADAIEALPEHYRQVLHLRLVHGMQLVQVARALGIPVGTAKTRMSRGTELLRARLPAGVGGVVLAGLACSSERLLAMRAEVLAAAPAAPAKVLTSWFGARLLVALLVLLAVGAPIAWALADDEVAAPGPTQAAVLDATPSSAERLDPVASLASNAAPDPALRAPAPSEATAPATVGCTVRGRLVAAPGGAPLRGRVAIVPAADFVNMLTVVYASLSDGQLDERAATRFAGGAKVGGDGAFAVQLEPSKAGRYRLVAEVEGRGRVVRSLGLLVGGERDLGDVELPAATLLRLRIVDEQQQPVAGARLMLAPPGRWQVFAGRPSGLEVVRRRADDAGELELYVAPGTYEVRFADDNRLRSAASIEVREQGVQREEIRVARARLLGRLAGKVVDPDGAPAPRMRVTLVGTQREVLTDANGRFAFDVPASVPFVMLQVDDITLRRFDHQVHDVTGPLDEEVVVTVQPLRGMRIAVVGRNRGEPVTRYAVVDLAALMPRCRYRNYEGGIAELPPAGGQTRQFVVVPSGDAYMPTSICSIPSNGEQLQKVVVHERVRLRVRVVSSGGQPLRGSTVELLDPAGRQLLGDEQVVYADELRSAAMHGRVLAVSEADTDADGWAELHGGDGTSGMVLRVRGEAHTPRLLRDVVVGERELQVVVQAGATLSGRLGDAEQMRRMFASHGPKRAMFGDAGRDPAPYGVFLTRGSLRLPTAGSTYALDEHGAFRAEGVLPGDWQVHLWLPQSFRAFGTSYRIGQVSVELGKDREFVCEVGKQIYGELHGELLLDGRQLAKQPFSLELEPSGQRPRLRCGGGTTDEHGRFALDEVLVGTYRVTLDRKDERGRFQRMWLPDPVQVVANQRRDVRLLATTRVARLLVLGADGKPVVGARIGVGAPDGGMVSPEHLITDAQGRLETSWVPYGPFRYHVQRGQRWVPFDFEMPAGQRQADWTLQLR